MKSLAISLIKKVWKLLKPLYNKEIKISKINRIVVILLGGIGDVLMCTAALRLLRKKFPNARIEVIAHSWSAQILNGNSFIDEIVFNPENSLEFVSLLKKRKYDLAVILEIFQENIYAYLAGIPYRIGYNIDGEDIFLNKSLKLGKETNYINYSLNVINLIKKSPYKESPSLDLYLSKSDIQFSEKLLKPFKGKVIIGINAGGGVNPWVKSPGKRWPAERYTQLIETLASKNRIFILFGDKNDSLISDKIKSLLNKAKVVDFSGKTSIKEAAAIIKKCKLFITNDSALMHVASAMNTPTISLFGPTNPKRLAPLNKNSTYIWQGNDINKISIKEIITAIKKNKAIK